MSKISVSNLQAIAGHLERGEDNGGITREALALQLRSVADELVSDADKLRRNFARYLAHDYLKNPANIADICDNSLDRTGALLGYVREAARNLKEHGVEEIAE